jgi:NADPH:quinone reductase-like Zn-dependent oxidoreductase
MRAFAVRSFGEAPGVHELPVPAADGEFLIRVSHAGVNPLDLSLLGRLTAASAYPFVVGVDFAGVIERAPGDERDLRAGDRVFGTARTHGSYAEYTAVGPGARMEPVALIPDGVPDEQAAALHAAHPDGVDAVLDLVSGRDAIRRDAEILKPGGSLVSTIFAADVGWFAERQITAHNNASSANPLFSPQGLGQVARMLADGVITARIRSTAGLEAAGQVLEKLRHGGLGGKAVIRL